MYNNSGWIKPKPGIQLNRAHPLAQGLVAYWPFNEGSGTVTRDINGKPGTLTNFALGGSNTSGWTGSPYGGGIRFDGTDDYVNIGKVLQPYIDYDRPFSVCISFAFTSYPSTSYYCFMGHIRTPGAGMYSDFTIRINPSDQIEFWLFSSPSAGVQDGFEYLSSAISVVVGKQYCLVCTYNGQNAATSGNIYLDGKSIYSSTARDEGAITQSIYQSGYLLDQDLWIGRRNWTTPDMAIPATIDSVRVYNRVITKDEIQALMINPFIDFHGSKAKVLIK